MKRLIGLMIIVLVFTACQQVAPPTPSEPEPSEPPEVPRVVIINTHVWFDGAGSALAYFLLIDNDIQAGHSLDIRVTGSCEYNFSFRRELRLYHHTVEFNIASEGTNFSPFTGNCDFQWTILKHNY